MDNQLIVCDDRNVLEFGDLIAGRLIEWRRYRGLSQDALGAMVGTNTNGRPMAGQLIGRYERGKTSPTTVQLDRIAGALGITVLEFLGGPPDTRRIDEPVPPVTILRENDTDRPRAVHTVAVPYYSSIPAGGWDSVSPEEIGDKEVLRHLVSHEGFVVVRVNGMSMFPRIMDGDLVLVDTKRKKPRSGEAVVAIYDGDTTLKRYRIINRHPVLTADNPEYPPLEIAHPERLMILGIVTDLIHRDLTKAQI